MPTPPQFVANFDSTTAMHRALSSYLHGRDFPGIGIHPRWLEPVARGINRLPARAREEFYSWSGWAEAIRKSELPQVDAEKLSEWITGNYPRRPYSAVAIGSSSGALVHLCAALGIPWLPQTFLIPVRRHGVHEDDPQADMRWGVEPGRQLLQANPQLQLHHMNDANQDRLMIKHMTYFRAKRLSLGPAYERFLLNTLAPGGTILLFECNLTWPVVKIADRHYFQHGALGGATQEEFRCGGPRVEQYLRRYRSPVRRWASPQPDMKMPEAEWGFEPELREDIERLARRHGYRVRRIVVDEPEHLSSLVAELYRWWYAQRGYAPSRLVVNSFLLNEPYWTLATGSTPYWMTFNKQPSAEALEAYLDEHGPFDEIYLMLFAHGVHSVGLVPIERWRELVGRARKKGSLLGVDEKEYPLDMSVYLRYHNEFRRLPSRYPIPGPLALTQLDQFLRQQAARHPVQWFEDEQRIYGPEELAVASSARSERQIC